MATNQRNDPCFWVEDKCPACGHSCPMVYTPDLLSGAVNRECGSKNNPIRKHTVCYEKWGFAATEERKEEIRMQLDVAKRQEVLGAEYAKNRKILGYT